jgi:FKBP-type peptidyl-prolyl cis-trans isomerase FkpA
MKKLVIISMFVCLGGTLFSENNQGKDNKNSSSKKVYPASYMLGVAITKNLSQYEFTKSEIDDIVKGFSDAMNKKITTKEIDYQSINSYIEEKKRMLADKNKKEGDKYLEKFIKEEGATKYDSGLVMKVITEGKGDIPSSSDTVKVHYRGYFIDGKEFDSSYKREQPVEFRLNQVIPCWTEALSKTKVGSKIKIGCPSKIAYGDNDMGPIPGGSTLLFDIEILDIVKNNNNANNEAKNKETEKSK